jgi:exodeoxyribonuclease VII small subunit
MAKKAANKPVKAAEKNSGTNPVKNFEQRLERLEELGEEIRKTDIPLDQALAAFEEGIKLARTLEKDLEKIDSRIEILINSAEAGDPDGDQANESPEMDLFETNEQ